MNDNVQIFAGSTHLSYLCDIATKNLVSALNSRLSILAKVFDDTPHLTCHSKCQNLAWNWEKILIMCDKKKQIQYLFDYF